MNLQHLRDKEVKTQDTEVFAFIDQLYIDTQKKYLKQHRDWYVNERFVRGDHWIVFNKTANKIQTIPIQDGEIRRTINKIRTQIRGVKNFIKRSQPRWEAHPIDATSESLENAIKVNKLLQYFYRTLKIPLLLTDTIVSGLKYSVGIIEGGMVKEGGKEKIKFWHNSTFDILFDPNSPTVNDCRFIFKGIKKPISSVEGNKNYTIKGNIKPDNNKDGVSSYKYLLDQEKYGQDESKGTKDLETVLVKEMWMKWEDEDGNIKIRVYTIAGNQLIRIHDQKYRRYPFFIYNPEKDAGSIYSDAWIKDLISPNKSLDKVASQTEAYIQRMLAGKFLIKQGVEVSSITDKGAEKIYYKGSVPPVQLQLQPLPSTPFTYSNNLERWIEEFGGAREATLGRVPGGLQSGKAIEALQTADANTVAEPIENLEFLVADISEFILELIADYTIASESIIEKGEEIKYTGTDGEDVEDALLIKPTEVTVRIVPEIAYSEEAKFDRLIRLAEAKVIDPQTILEKLAISNISDILERMKVVREEEFKQDMIKQKESHRTSGDAPEDTADLADQENMQMAAGQQIPPTPQALWTPEHTELHLAFIQENRDAYTQQQAIFDDHIQQEEQYNQQ